MCHLRHRKVAQSLGNLEFTLQQSRQHRESVTVFTGVGVRVGGGEVGGGVKVKGEDRGK